MPLTLSTTPLQCPTCHASLSVLYNTASPSLSLTPTSDSTAHEDHPSICPTCLSRFKHEHEHEHPPKHKHRRTANEEELRLTSFPSLLEESFPTTSNEGASTGERETCRDNIANACRSIRRILRPNLSLNFLSLWPSPSTNMQNKRDRHERDTSPATSTSSTTSAISSTGVGMDASKSAGIACSV